MKCHSQETLYLVFILIVVAGTMIYWYTSPTYGINGTNPPQTAKDKMQYWGALILLLFVAVVVFIAAMNSTPMYFNVAPGNNSQGNASPAVIL